MNQKADWNPESYLKFGNERTQPSIDLVHRIQIDYQPQTIIDIGCGPGNSGKILSDRWPQAKLRGIDSSPNMIEKAKNDFPRHEWILADAALYETDDTFDIVFSNAAIQWIPNHEALLKRLCALLSGRGVLALQLPLFRDMPLGSAIARIAQKEQWKSQTAHCSKLFTYHDYAFYYDQLARALASIELWETSYVHVMESHAAIIDWVRPTGLRPYLDSLRNDAERLEFERDLLHEIKALYPVQHDGKVLFPFKRLFVIGYKVK
jgi:trans-aconitate 2-methyltransferase